MWIVIRTRRDRKRDSVSSFRLRCGVGKDESAYKGLTVKHAISIAPSPLRPSISAFYEEGMGFAKFIRA